MAVCVWQASNQDVATIVTNLPIAGSKSDSSMPLLGSCLSFSLHGSQCPLRDPASHFVLSISSISRRKKTMLRYVVRSRMSLQYFENGLNRNKEVAKTRTNQCTFHAAMARSSPDTTIPWSFCCTLCSRSIAFGRWACLGHLLLPCCILGPRCRIFGVPTPCQPCSLW